MAVQVNVVLVAVLVVTVSVTGMLWGVLELPVTATEMAALWVPAASPARLTLVVTAAVAVPVDGDSVNHVALSLAVQVMDPVPVFVTVSVCAVGLFPPTVPVKARLAGARLTTGVVVDAVSVKVTGTGLVTPPPESVAVPLYVPEANPFVEAVCVMVAVPPGAIDTVSPDVAMSQLMVSCHVTVNVAEPVFAIVTPATTLGPPTVPV